MTVSLALKEQTTPLNNTCICNVIHRDRAISYLIHVDTGSILRRLGGQKIKHQIYFKCFKMIWIAINYYKGMKKKIWTLQFEYLGISFIENSSSWGNWFDLNKFYCMLKNIKDSDTSFDNLRGLHHNFRIL